MILHCPLNWTNKSEPYCSRIDLIIAGQSAMAALSKFARHGNCRNTRLQLPAFCQHTPQPPLTQTEWEGQIGPWVSVRISTFSSISHAISFEVFFNWFSGENEMAEAELFLPAVCHFETCWIGIVENWYWVSACSSSFSFSLGILALRNFQ